MDEYIEKRKALIAKVTVTQGSEYAKGWNDAIDAIVKNVCDFADVVEVVRCKDCKHFVCDMDLNHEEYPNEIEADGLCQITDKYCDMPHFCSYGERREGNGEG